MSAPSSPGATASGSQGLQAELRLRRGDWDLNLDLFVPPGSTVALLGPNGAGKSTALQLLAGLLRLPSGRISCAGRVLDDPAVGLHVGPARRSVGVVFQDHLLFPHLDAIGNVAFGLRSRGVPRERARADAQAWLVQMGLAGLEHRRPSNLSGGQAQRVALARALVTRPDLLLLDEPLAALDALTRAQVRTDLHRHLGDFAGACVLVTHDPLDAMVLADELVIIQDGRVVQTGTPSQVARAPRTEFVARLVGLNLVRGTAQRLGPAQRHGTAQAHQVQLDGGGVLHLAAGATGQVLVAFAPSAVSLSMARPLQASPRNTWQCTVAGLERQGGTIRVRLDGRPGALVDVTVAAVAELGLAPGVVVWASLKATEIVTYPA